MSMQGKKRILFVITQFYKGGAEVALINLLKEMDATKYEVDLLVSNQIKLKGLVSMIPSLPSWVNVYSPAEKTANIYNIVVEVVARGIEKITNVRPLRGANLIREKQYDWAITYGEWVPLKTVANLQNAKNKAVWIHTDIDKSVFFDSKHFFVYDSNYTNYIFVSENSMDSAIKKYPYFKNKSCVIHNLADLEQIQQQSKEPVPEKLAKYFTIPVILSVGNVRPEKNYPRQIEAMAILQRQGVECIWLVVGGIPSAKLAEQLKEQIVQAGLEEKFVFVGSDDNPYGYMKKSAVVTNLGDYESWSMVITEALYLEKAVIATKTSGALEQITDGENGLLCEFTAQDIAEKIKKYLSDKTLQKKIATSKVNKTFDIGSIEFNELIQSG